MGRKRINPQQTEEEEEEEDNNNNSNSTPSNTTHNQQFSNLTPILHPSYNGPMQSAPQVPQFAGSEPSFPIPTNFIAPSLPQGSLSVIRHPHRFNNTQTHQISSNGVLALPFHVNGYPFYMSAGIMPAFYQLPMPNFMVPSIPPGIVHPTHSRPAQNRARISRPQTNYYNEIIAPLPRPAQNYVMQFRSQTNDNSGITAPRPRPAQNYGMQFLSQTNDSSGITAPRPRPAQNLVRQSRSQTNDNNGILVPPSTIRNSPARVLRGSGNINPTRFRQIQNRASEIYPHDLTQLGAYNSSGWAYHGSLMDQNNEFLTSHPMMHSFARQQFGSDHQPFSAHERPYRPDSRFYNRRSQNRNRELGHFPDYIERDRLVEQPREVEHRCDLCNEDLLANSTNDREIDPVNIGHRFHVQNITETAVLPCQHAFHMSCLQSHTNHGIDLVELPCPICSTVLQL